MGQEPLAIAKVPCGGTTHKIYMMPGGALAFPNHEPREIPLIVTVSWAAEVPIREGCGRFLGSWRWLLQTGYSGLYSFEGCEGMDPFLNEARVKTHTRWKRHGLRGR